MFSFNKTKNIADYIIYELNNQNIEITHLKLQKLMYFCQKYSLKMYDRALFDDDFEAWVHGPVLPKIYKLYAKFGWESIPSNSYTIFLFHKDKEIINYILEQHKFKKGKELEILSHKDGAWLEARSSLSYFDKSNTIINKKSIKGF